MSQIKYDDSQQLPVNSAPIPNFHPMRNRRDILNKFLTFVFALLPGAGQMYQGLMKKGVSVMLLFFGIIAFSILTYLEFFMLTLPVVWFYAFFDTINRMNYTRDELKTVEDEFLIKFPNIGNEDGKFNQLLKSRHKLLGFSIIMLGIYAILRTLNYNFYYYDAFDNTQWRFVYEVIRDILNTLPRLFIPIICIFIGVKLIKPSKVNTAKEIENKGEND